MSNFTFVVICLNESYNNKSFNQAIAALERECGFDRHQNVYNYEDSNHATVLRNKKFPRRNHPYIAYRRQDQPSMTIVHISEYRKVIEMAHRYGYKGLSNRRSYNGLENLINPVILPKEVYSYRSHSDDSDSDSSCYSDDTTSSTSVTDETNCDSTSSTSDDETSSSDCYSSSVVTSECSTNITSECDTGTDSFTTSSTDTCTETLDCVTETETDSTCYTNTDTC